MRTGIPVLAVLSLWLVTAACGDREQAQQDQAKLAALEKENLALKRQVAELESKLSEFYAEQAGRTYTHQVTIPFDGQPEPEHLRGIELPEDATKPQVRQYVAKIMRSAVQHRGGYGAQDPEVAMLERVGAEHVDVLLEPLLHEMSPNGDIYLIEALKSLARDEHKELVLSSLPLARQLVQVVQLRGWIEEAAPTLLEVLEDRDSWNPSLPTEWIEAVASLERPDTYEALKNFLYYGTNRYHTWKAIRDLPGMDVNAEVKQLWGYAKELDDKWQRLNVAAVAAHYGHLDALEVMFEEPDRWREWEVIESVTPYEGRRNRPEQAKEWFRLHQANLVFDRSAQRFELDERSTPQKPSASGKN